MTGAGDGSAGAPPEIRSHVDAVFRAESARVHATLTADFGDLDVAEEAVQDAFTQALRQWPRDGVPDRPGAWITTTARRRAIDRLRREARRADKEATAVRGLDAHLADAEDTTGGAWAEDTTGGAWAEDADEPVGSPRPPVDDDQLRLMFTCCHPALSPEAQVALTLRLVCGLRTTEIARLFLVPEPTLAQRLVRAKAKVRTAGIPFRVPAAHLLPDRLGAVLACIYLVFTEGYAASTDPIVRPELCDEAVRLAALVVELMPDEPEARGLLALLVLQDSRRAARVDDDGQLVGLEDQDRTRWDRDAIARGVAQLDHAAARRRPGPYQLQAAIAATHAQAADWAAIDWVTIARLYEALARLTPSPVVELNRAVAVGYAEGPEAGLAIVGAAADDPRVADGHVLPATRGHLLELSGRPDEAADAFTEAIALAPVGAEQTRLRRRLAALADRPRCAPAARGAHPPS